MAGTDSSRRLTAINRAAHVAGLRTGLRLADALAQVPALRVAPADDAADQALLRVLAERCGMVSPWTAPDIPDGIWIDGSGCAHLFGGEAAMLALLRDKLAAQGFAVRVALATTPGAAWAWARFGHADTPILGDPGQLTPLPLAALRLPPDTVAELSALGLRRVGDLLDLPRAQVSLRFGRQVLWRLDQALGNEPEPINPLVPVAAHRVHMALPEPIARTEDVTRCLHRLLDQLCGLLAKEDLGVRGLTFTLFRVDGSLARIEAGTSAPSRDAAHLLRLFRDKLDGVQAGFGFEAARLDAPATQALSPEQASLNTDDHGDSAPLPPLLDALGNRLGPQRLMRLVPRPSHVPERMVARIPVAATVPALDWPTARYPLRLLDPPEPIEAMAPIPDAPPVRFRWQGRLHQVIRADGPERIAPEWWAEDGDERDYYRVEDSTGLRLWLYRLGHYGAGPPPRWYLHGLFA